MRPRWPLRPLAVRVVKQLVRTISGMLGKLLMLNDVCRLSLLAMIDELALIQATQHFLMGSLTIVIGGSDRTLGTATRFHVLNPAIGNACSAPYGLPRRGEPDDYVRLRSRPTSGGHNVGTDVSRRRAGISFRNEE